jgi:hypothetical protein
MIEMNAAIQRITDIALEARIRARSYATRLFLWLGDEPAARQCWASMCALIAKRSDAQVARMEKARGLR